MSINVRQTIKEAEAAGEKVENQSLLYYGVTDKFAEKSNEAIDVALGLKLRNCESTSYLETRIFEEMEYSKFMVIISILNLNPTIEELGIMDEIWEVLKRHGKEKSYR